MEHIRLRIEKRLTFCPNGSIINSNKRPSCCLPQPQGVFADLTSNFCEIRSMKEESLASLHCRLWASSVPDRHALHGLSGQVASHAWVLQLRKTTEFTEENWPKCMATWKHLSLRNLPLEGKAVHTIGKKAGVLRGRGGSQSQIRCTMGKKLSERPCWWLIY